MVRQDKITFLITFFQSECNTLNSQTSIEKWYSNYEFPKYSFPDFSSQSLSNSDIFYGNMINTRVLYRIGVLFNFDLCKTNKLMTEFIPVSRHFFLYANIEKFGSELCTALMPLCNDCKLSEICDYFNNKNIWEE